jgi:hypothetical protein
MPGDYVCDNCRNRYTTGGFCYSCGKGYASWDGKGGSAKGGKAGGFAFLVIAGIAILAALTSRGGKPNPAPEKQPSQPKSISEPKASQPKPRVETKTAMPKPRPEVKTPLPKPRAETKIPMPKPRPETKTGQGKAKSAQGGGTSAKPALDSKSTKPK